MWDTCFTSNNIAGDLCDKTVPQDDIEFGLKDKCFGEHTLNLIRVCLLFFGTVCSIIFINDVQCTVRK